MSDSREDFSKTSAGNFRYEYRWVVAVEALMEFKVGQQKVTTSAAATEAWEVGRE